jgi:hypothetical protein
MSIDQIKRTSSVDGFIESKNVRKWNVGDDRGGPFSGRYTVEIVLYGLSNSLGKRPNHGLETIDISSDDVSAAIGVALFLVKVAEGKAFNPVELLDKETWRHGSKSIVEETFDVYIYGLFLPRERT